MSQENNFIPEQESYKTLTPFRLFVKSNFPFIESTYEALDNYGLYCKVVEYLNQVIANEQVVTTNVQALYDSFVSLNNYVSNYFDNLDVQDEINNKLDEMATNGELQGVLHVFFENLENEYDERFDALSNTFNASQTVQNNQISALSSRVDSFTHLTEGSTTGDAELIDARIGADGQTYSSVGSAIRNQVEDLQNFYNFDWNKNPINKKYMNKYNIEFEIGALDSNGQEVENAQRLRTNFIDIDGVNNFWIYTPANLMYNVYVYSKEKVYESSWGYITGNLTGLEEPANKCYRIVFATTDWHLPDINMMKQNTLVYYNKFEDFLHDDIGIGTTNINNALDYGFKNNGLSSQPNDTALSNYITEHPYEPLYFPAGRYIFAYPVTVDKICFYLDNQAILEYNQYGANITSFINIQNTENKRCFLKGGQIQCNNLSYTGVRVYNAHYFTIENLIINGATGIGVTTNPVAGEGNKSGRSCTFKNIRATRTSALSVDNVGFNDLGYDNTIEEFVCVDFTIGIIAGGGDKLIRCHPWLSSSTRYENSIAYIVDYSTVELDSCVVDTYQRGVKTRANNTIITANNLRIFNNSDVVNTGDLIVFQGTNVGGTYQYPILHVSNVSINNWGGTTKLIDFEIPSEIYNQYCVSGVTQSTSIINDSFTIEKRLQALEQ